MSEAKPWTDKELAELRDDMTDSTCPCPRCGVVRRAIATIATLTREREAAEEEASICMAWAAGEISGGRARELARGVSTWEKMVDRLNLALEKCGCGKDRWSELWHTSPDSTTTEKPKSLSTQAAPEASSCCSKGSGASSDSMSATLSERLDTLTRERDEARGELSAVKTHGYESIAQMASRLRELKDHTLALTDRLASAESRAKVLQAEVEAWREHGFYYFTKATDAVATIDAARAATDAALGSSGKEAT